MATLNPQVRGSVGFEQPVAPAPSAFDALASLGEAFAPVFAGSGEQGSGGQAPYGERKDARDQARLIGLQDSLLKTAEVEKQSGLEAARAYERKVLVNFVRDGGDINDPNVKEAISLVTGQDAELVGRSPEEIAVNEIKTTPEYSEYYLASYSFLEENATEDQRVNWAVQKTVQNNAYDIMLQDENFDWVTNNGEQIIGSKIDTFVDSRLGGMHALVQNGQPVTFEMLKGAESEWMVARSQIQNRLPKEPDLRRNTENKIKMVDEMFDFFETMTSGSDMNGVEGITFSRNAQSVWKALQEGKISSIEGNIFLQTMKETPEFFLSFGFIEPSELLDTMTALDTSIDSNNIPDASGKSAEEKGEQAGVVSRFLNKLATYGPRVGMAPNPEVAKTGVYSIVSNLTGLAENDRRFLSKNALQEIFNGGVVKTVKDTEGPEGYQMADSMFTAIDQQYAVAEMAMVSMLRGTGLAWDRSTNSFTTTDDLSTLSSAQSDLLTEAADKFYEGDIAALVLDKGSRVDMPVRGPGDTRRNTLRTTISSLETKMKQVNKQRELVNFLNNKRLEFGSIRDSKIEGGGGVSNLGGSAGGDTLIMNLIDRTEGGGDYDTLFSFANRSGREFEGVKVSTMTLKELDNFANGPYGEWSKNKLGYKATPMGRYQFVGTTLKNVADRMGLPTNTVFTPEVQDAMFHFYAKERLAGANTPAEKRSILRAGWEGFNSVSDTELDRAIAQFEGTDPPSLADIQTRSSNMSTTPSTSPRPEMAPDTRESVQVGGDTSAQQPQRATESVADSPQSTPEGATTGQPSEAALQAAQRTFDQLSREQKNFLEKLLGPEEETVFMLATRQIQKEDIPK